MTTPINFTTRNIERRNFFFITAMAILVNLLLLSSRALEAAAGYDDPELGPPPGSYRILSDDGVISFPFEMFRGDIKFDGEMNGHPVRMLVDNGVMAWDQILFFGSPLDDSLGFKFDGEIEVGGSGQGDRKPSRTASSVTIRFPGVEFTNQTAIVMPYRGVPNPWIVEGQVCGTFFKHFAVEVNYDKMMMTLTPFEKFEYHGSGQEIPIKPLGGGVWGFPATLELTDGRVISMDVSMDLGYGDQIEISTTGEHQLFPPSNVIPGSLGFGIQGETLGHYGRIKNIQIGKYKLGDVVVGFIDPEYTGSTFSEAMVGLGLLSRFNFIYDYPHRRMFIAPNHTFNEPFEYNMSGLWTGRLEGDYLAIRQVLPESPAAEAGITAKDKIAKINGRPARELRDPWELTPILTQEGRAVTLVLMRGEEEVEVSIKLRRLI